MTLETMFHALFAARPEIDELLFDGFEILAEVIGDVKFYRPSPLRGLPLHAIQDFALGQGVRWDPMQPAAGGHFSVIEGKLESHYRWHGLLPPVARDGLLLSIRRHRLGQIALKDFVSDTFQRQKILENLKSDSPVLVMGETGSGKTSFLVSVLLEIAFEERVAVLEHLPELPRLSPRWIRLKSQSRNLAGDGEVSLEYLIDELLRLRPDRLVVGELRREEVKAYKRALLAGHGSVWTTVHAGSPDELPMRLQELGAAPENEWRRVLMKHEAFVVQLSRRHPRFRGLFRFRDGGIEQVL